MTETDDSKERLAREAWTRGDMDAAATLVYEAYGRELYSFLLAQFPRSSSADDVFSQFNEDFWRGLPGFEWRCSIRAWCYQLARNAAHRYRRAPHNDRKRHAPFNSAPWSDALVQPARTSTRPHLKTEIKDAFQRLRDKLTREDQDLLILRVDRDLSWHDVTHAMLLADQVGDDAVFARREAALRQRFVEVKKRLKALAIEAGLLSGKRTEGE